MEITRLFDILPHVQETYPEQEFALAGKQKNDEWKKYTIDEYVEFVNALSYGLIGLGVQKDDKIAIISNNRPEWAMLDMAIMQVGAITVPIYPTISEDDYLYILNHAEISCLFVEEHLLRKVTNVLAKASTVKHVYIIDEKGDFETFDDLVEVGKNNPAETKLEKRKNAVEIMDICCIIYTSGTTGNPKGVMLSHYNIINQLFNLEEILSDWVKVATSFLPLCHAYEKMLVYLYQYKGFSVYFLNNLATLSEDIKATNPNIMTTVPRILEKIYDKLYATGKKLPFFQRRLYFWAFNLATKYKLPKTSKYYQMRQRIADKLIYHKWREAIGGNFDIVVSGSAAIQPKIAAFFSAIGMPVFEGYGLTETSPVIAVSRRDWNGRRFGTVGLPLPGVEVRLTEKNEIICRGHNVMKGYYKEPELTRETIDENGWLHTGDTGKFTDEGQLIITGRLKAIFKTSLGKYINPQLIEAKFALSPFIENIVVLGENQKFAAALIVPEFHFLKTWYKKNKMTYTSNEEAVESEEVKRLFDKILKKYNAHFANYERVKKYILVSDEWSQDNDILTPTMKVKRRVIEERYKHEIEKLFE